MKRAGFLYEKLLDRELIRDAIIKASRKKRRRRSVRRILNNIDHYVDELYTMIANESFTPSPYRRFQIKDGATQKVREICCPKFYPDQIVHWMMILVLEPVFMRGMCETNCGSVPGRGAHYGKKRIEKWYKLDRKNTKYCAKLDIRKFYPSSKAPAVMQELRHVIKCKRMLRLCETGAEQFGRPADWQLHLTVVCELPSAAARPFHQGSAPHTVFCPVHG